MFKTIQAFFHRAPDEAAALRDENIKLGTENIFLRDMVERQRRPERERRRDARDIAAARAATTAALSALTDKQKDAQR